MRVLDLTVDPAEARVYEAALRCFARWGVAKTTLDDVAREAGCSRATVYRVVPGGRDALVERVVQHEVARFFAGLHERLRREEALEDLVVAGIVYAGRFLSGHDALRFVLAHEPELILPRISFARMREVLAAAAEAVAPHLAPHVGEEAAVRAGEWLARLVVSYTICPSPWVDICDEGSVRSLVRTFVLPGLVQQVAV
jgi:AcrR family transcriptional regulator